MPGAGDALRQACGTLTPSPRPPMTIQTESEIQSGICEFRARGTGTLVEAVDMIAEALAYCRRRGLGRLLIDAAGLEGIATPTLVDRFLAVEEWARTAGGMVVAALVVEDRLIHADKFGVRVAADLGLTAEVFTDAVEARAWLATIA